MTTTKDKVQNPQNPETTSQPTDQTDLPLVSTVDEVSDLLRVNRKTVYEMISRNELPGVVRTGRKIRISTQAVLDWLNGQSRPSKASRRLP